MKINIINDSNMDTRGMDPLVTSLCDHAQQVLGYSEHPDIRFVSDPKNYGLLAKTAEYDPNNSTVSVYVDGRHPKDILRSIAHELVHHHQNERGELSGGHTGAGYAQSDPHMRDMEAKAYLYGNLKVFRDWEDRIKQDNPSIYNERRIHKMSDEKLNEKKNCGCGQDPCITYGITEAEEKPKDEEEKAEESEEETEEDDKDIAARTPPKDKLNKGDFLPPEVRKDLKESTKDWKNKELNRLLMKKWGYVKKDK